MASGDSAGIVGLQLMNKINLKTTILGTVSSNKVVVPIELVLWPEIAIAGFVTSRTCEFKPGLASL
jgi:hypothetical protein